MSRCISRHGEYDAHELDDEYVCGLCGVLDEDALLVEVRELRKAAAQAARELETLGMKYTVAHPENTMRVLELLWKDEHRIAADLRKVVDGDGP